MSIGVGEDIGLETHGDIDQFIRIEGCAGKAILDDVEYELKGWIGGSYPCRHQA